MTSSGRRRPTAAAFCAVLLLTSSVASAQIGAGRLAGTVKDERGRAIKGATVVAENEDIGRSFTAATDEKGRFSVIGLRSGTWEVRVEASGFHALTLDVPIRTIRSNPAIEIELVRRPDPGPPPLLGGADPERLQRDIDHAASLVTAGQFDAALAAYRRLLDRHPALTAINLQVGYLLERKGDGAAALTAYRAALAADPSSSPAREAIARLEEPPAPNREDPKRHEDR